MIQHSVSGTVRALPRGSSHTWIQYKQLMSKRLVVDVKSHLHATHQQQLLWTVAAEAMPCRHAKDIILCILYCTYPN